MALNQGTALQTLAARIDDGASIQSGLGLGLIAPVGTRVIDTVQIAHRNFRPDPVLIITRLEG